MEESEADEAIKRRAQHLAKKHLHLNGGKIHQDFTTRMMKTNGH
jgi:hypothetical protein